MGDGVCLLAFVYYSPSIGRAWSIVATGSHKTRVGFIRVDGVEVLRIVTPIPMALGRFLARPQGHHSLLFFRRMAYDGRVVTMMLENS